MRFLSSIISQNGLSYKMPIHVQQHWKTDELKYCHILPLRHEAHHVFLQNATAFFLMG